jgi:chromosome segregation ATPase
VLHQPSEQHRAAAQQVAEGVHRRNLELEAQLGTRDAEISRLGAMCAQLRAKITDCETAAAAARRAGGMMTAEVDELRSQLAIERSEHAACRDQRQRLQQRGDELEARVAAQERKARRDHDEGERSRKDLESRLRMTDSELATAKAALAAATDNVRALQQAHADALLRLETIDRDRAHP